MQGSLWGEEFLISNPVLMDWSKVIALTHAEVLTLTRDGLDEILEDFPLMKSFLRKVSGKIAFRRVVKLIISERHMRRRSAQMEVFHKHLTNRTRMRGKGISEHCILFLLIGLRTRFGADAQDQERNVNRTIMVQ